MEIAMPFGASDDEAAADDANGAPDPLNDGSLSYPEWLELRNGQIASAGQPPSATGDDEAAAPVLPPASEPNLPLAYDSSTGRFRVLTDPDEIADATPPPPLVDTAADQAADSADAYGADAASQGGADSSGGAAQRPTLSPGQPGAGAQSDFDGAVAAGRFFQPIGHGINNVYDTFHRPFVVDGTPSDPGPGRVYDDWRSGKAPQSQDFGPDSRFTREFVQAPAVRDHLSRAIGAWKARPGGWGAQGGRYTNGAASFGPSDYIADALAGNTAAHEIGSFNLDGAKRGDRIDWTATNNMGQHSFAFGHWFDKFHIPTDADISGSKPRHTIHQTIRFSTDLEGNPIGG